MGQFRSLYGALGVDGSVCGVYQGDYPAKEEEAEDSILMLSTESFASEKKDLEEKDGIIQ
jgi:hypothetical protein